MRYTGPKNRIARREGMDLGLKTPGTKSHASLLKKISVPPGQHGTRGRRKTSEHSKQLREKQKVRFIFGVTETQMKNYFKVASHKKGNTGVILIQMLEQRLDSMVHRLGFAPTRAAARQLITHKHMKVNDKLVNVASYVVKVGDVITFGKDTTKKIPAIETALAQADLMLPSWLTKEDAKGTVVALPSAEIIEKQINLRLVVEFYSR